jgi:hypothetical protein
MFFLGRKNQRTFSMGQVLAGGRATAAQKFLRPFSKDVCLFR